MEQRYSDFIRMQADFQPVYDITAERTADAWKSFIPTAQFCRLLNQTLTAMTSGEQSTRKGMEWSGTATELLEQLERKKPEDYEDVIARFVMALEFKLFDGLYMGDLEDLIETGDVSEKGGTEIC